MNGKAINRTLVVFTLVCTALTLSLASPAWSAESDYHGTYAGTYSGPDFGVWVAIVASSYSDSVFLSYSQRDGFGDGGHLNFGGEDAGEGLYYSQSVINESSINAYVTASTGSVSGDWYNTYSGENGSLEGNAITSSPQAGTYAGTIAGDATGTWSMTVASNGYITGTINVEGETSSLEGGVHPDGYMVAIGTDSYGDFSVFGRISGSSASGSWYSESGAEGTFTTGSGSGGGGGGGGGGCFISSLAGE